MLKDINFGNADGKKEAKLIPEFDELFYDYGCMYEKINKPGKYLVLGRKGTGKTLLAYYLKRELEEESAINIIDIESLKNVHYQNLLRAKVEEENPREYYDTWRWIILLALSNTLLKNQSLGTLAEYQKLYDFIYNEISTGELSLEKIVDVSKKAYFEITIDFFKTGLEKSKQKVKVSYLDLIEPLFELVKSIAANTEGKVYYILDEIDDQFRSRDRDKRQILIGMIKAVDDINTTFLDYNPNIKIVLLLRTDIFYSINHADLEKINQDASILLEWQTRDDYKSPAFEVVLFKIKKSLKLSEDTTFKTVYDKYFWGTISEGIDPAHYILDRTMLRPRDTITFMNLLKEKKPSIDTIRIDDLSEIEVFYSGYLKRDIRNELVAHFSERYIDDLFILLKLNRRKSFSFAQILATYNSSKQRLKIPDLKKALEDMYEYSIIGNYYESVTGQPRIRFNYRDSGSILDLDTSFVLHKGLEKDILR